VIVRNAVHLTPGKNRGDLIRWEVGEEFGLWEQFENGSIGPGFNRVGVAWWDTVDVTPM